MVCNLLQLGLHGSPLLFRLFTHYGSWRERGREEREDQAGPTSFVPTILGSRLGRLAKSTRPAHWTEALGLGEDCLACLKPCLGPSIRNNVGAAPGYVPWHCSVHQHRCAQRVCLTGLGSSMPQPQPGLRAGQHMVWALQSACQYGHSQGIPPVSPASV